MRLGGGAHRLDLQLSGASPEIVRIESPGGLVLATLEARDDAAQPAEPGWSSGRWVGVARQADEAMRRQFIRLWDAAGTTKYDKQEWRNYCRMLQDAGYWA